MDAKPLAVDPERRITRRQLEVVIRRAAELYAADTDADERISEAELLRIAEEIGLPARYVRQALYEAIDDAEATVLDRIAGPGNLIVARSIPVDAGPILRHMEEYLVTREYLQLRRRQGEKAVFVPADDLISRFARSLSRPARRFHLARARAVGVEVHQLEPGWAHIRLEVDLSVQRNELVRGGGILAGIFGAAAGTGLAILTAPVAGAALGDLAGIIAGTTAFVGTAAASTAAGIAAAAARFRARAAAAREEIEVLLDRAQRGETLDPPPAPWRRSLQARLFKTQHGR